MPTPRIRSAPRRAATRVAALAALAVSCLACGRASEQDASTPPHNTIRPPDVFLVSIDTLRADHLSGAGYPRETSPFLDQLSAEGVVVREAVVATHGTAPSHASMLTSVPQEVHGVGLRGRTDDVVPSSLRNLPEVFGEAGYHTVAVTEGGNVGRAFGFDRGFDVFNDRARGIEEGRDRLVPHLSGVPDDQPVFVFFHTYEVHSPYDPPPDLAGRFGAPESSFVTSSRNLVDHAHRAGDLTPEDLEHIRARYDEGIVHADRVLRSIFDELEQLGRLDDALVVVTSDHGEEFGEHGGLVHRDLLYEELLRVPMIFWGPALPPGVRAPRQASSLDLAPTLTSCAGLDVPSSWHGRDLLCSRSGQIASGQTGDADEELRPLISQYGDRRYSVRTDRWKLIVTRLEEGAPGEGTSEELYDLGADPRETRNLADQEPEMVDALRRVLRRWKAGLETVESDAGPVQLDPEERRRLEALGYL